MNNKDNSVASLTGFFITINAINSYIVYINLIALINLSMVHDVLVFVLIIICFCIYVITYPGGIPTFLQGDKVGNDFRGRDGPVLCYIAYWVISLVLVIFFLGDVMLYRVYFSPTGYLFLTNVYFINIVCNVIGKRTISDHPASMLINAFFIGYFPFTHYGPTLWVDGFNTTWVIWFL